MYVQTFPYMPRVYKCTSSHATSGSSLSRGVVVCAIGQERYRAFQLRVNEKELLDTTLVSQVRQANVQYDETYRRVRHTQPCNVCTLVDDCLLLGLLDVLLLHR